MRCLVRIWLFCHFTLSFEHFNKNSMYCTCLSKTFRLRTFCLSKSRTSSWTSPVFFFVPYFGRLPEKKSSIFAFLEKGNGESLFKSTRQNRGVWPRRRGQNQHPCTYTHASTWPSGVCVYVCLSACLLHSYQLSTAYLAHAFGLHVVMLAAIK